MREIRLSRGLRQVDLCSRVGCDWKTVRKAERGDLLGITTGSLLRFAAALDCGPADLFPVLAARLDRPARVSDPGDEI